MVSPYNFYWQEVDKAADDYTACSRTTPKYKEKVEHL